MMTVSNPQIDEVPATKRRKGNEGSIEDDGIKDVTIGNTKDSKVLQTAIQTLDSKILQRVTEGKESAHCSWRMDVDDAKKKVNVDAEDDRKENAEWMNVDALNEYFDLLKQFQMLEARNLKSVVMKASEGTGIENVKGSPSLLHSIQHDVVPVYNGEYLRGVFGGANVSGIGNSGFGQNGSVDKPATIKKTQIQKTRTEKTIYDRFYDGAGCFIVRGAYTKKLMREFNQWCENYLEKCKNTDPNCRHPKQKGKYLINDILSRLIETGDEKMLFSLFYNPILTNLLDTLLGFGKFGAATAHWIESKADRQLSHVDYPMHVGSGPFWEADRCGIDKMQRLTTRYQVNHILPYYSVQVLLAADAMNIENGSTEVVPCSHRCPDMDATVHNRTYYQRMESEFHNVTLEQGDLLFFCRRLCHRGGKNQSDNRRNALILQCVWLWGIGQEIIESAKILEKLKPLITKLNLSPEEKEKVELRLKCPFPKDVKKGT